MTTTRSTRTRRAATRANTKRTILSALDENKPATIEELQKIPIHKTVNSIRSTSPQNLPDVDATNAESIRVLLQDIRQTISARQESLSIKGAEIAKNQQEVFFVGTMKLEKSVKKMTIGNFNRKFMQEGESIVKVLQSMLVAEELKVGMAGAVEAMAKKRSRDFESGRHHTVASMPGAAAAFHHLPLSGNPHRTDLETPVRQLTLGKPCRTPGTILRTAKKGESMFSQNGSPIDRSEAGDIVATVSKKRKANGNDSSMPDTVFDINIGDGRYISLSDPTTVGHLTNEMKSSAKNQLNVLQDQLSKLLSQLN